YFFVAHRFPGVPHVARARRCEPRAAARCTRILILIRSTLPPRSRTRFHDLHALASMRAGGGGSLRAYLAWRCPAARPRASGRLARRASPCNQELPMKGDKIVIQHLNKQL